MEQQDRAIIVSPTDPQWGPGGHLYVYRAVYADGQGNLVGLGQTEQEARQHLTKLSTSKEEDAKPKPTGPKQVGWFVWTRRNGAIGGHKYIVEGDRIHRDTKDYYESMEIPGTKVPLTQKEWDLSLDELYKKYPLPKEVANATK